MVKIELSLPNFETKVVFEAFDDYEPYKVLTIRYITIKGLAWAFGLTYPILLV